jgi:hypothetical protein
MRAASCRTLLAAGLALAIEADPSARWSIACSVTEGGVTRELRRDGSGRLGLEVAAERMDCSAVLLAGDRMSLTVTDGRGNRSRSSVSGAGSTARLRVG